VKIFDPDPSRRWQFVFTHPDDELAIAAWMRRLVQAGAKVFAVWSVAIPVREQEARATMRKIGVPDEHLTFFRFPDGSACDYLQPISGAMRDLFAATAPTDLVVPAFECGHLDHDSTHFAACGAAPSGIRIAEYPLYYTYLTRFPILNRFADPAGEQRIELTAEEVALKSTLSRNYPSQNIRSLLIWYAAAGWLRIRPRDLVRAERLRPKTVQDYLKPNLPADLAGRVMRCEKWKRWERCVRAAVSCSQCEETS